MSVLDRVCLFLSPNDCNEGGSRVSRERGGYDFHTELALWSLKQLHINGDSGAITFTS